METIVASGTKLNLGYAIDDMLDEDEQDEIMDYFKTAKPLHLMLQRRTCFRWL